jgi:hypothetical protein
MNAIQKTLCTCSVFLIIGTNFTGCSTPTVFEPTNIASILDASRIVRTLSSKQWKQTAVFDANIPRMDTVKSTVFQPFIRFQLGGTVVAGVRETASGKLQIPESLGIWFVERNRIDWGIKDVQWLIVVGQVSLTPNQQFASRRQEYILLELSSSTLVLGANGRHGMSVYFYEPE